MNELCHLGRPYENGHFMFLLPEFFDTGKIVKLTVIYVEGKSLRVLHSILPLLLSGSDN